MQTDPWVAESICPYCAEPIGNRPWWNEGNGHVEQFVHAVCDPEAMRAESRRLRQRLYEAEAVCWAKRRLEQVGDRSVDPAGDQAQYEQAWAHWNAVIDGLRAGGQDEGADHGG